MIQPNSIEDYAEFIIFKPGYGNFPGQRKSPPMGMPLGDIETFFSKETGSRGNVEILVIKDNKSEWKLVEITTRVVELPPITTWEERNKANMLSPTDDKNEWPQLNEIIEKEDNWLRHNKGWRR